MKKMKEQMKNKILSRHGMVAYLESEDENELIFKLVLPASEKDLFEHQSDEYIEFKAALQAMGVYKNARKAGKAIVYTKEYYDDRLPE